MGIQISGRQIDNLSWLNCGSVTGWGRWRAGQWWSRPRSRLSVWVGWGCTCSFGSPVCLLMLCGAILARKAAGRLVLTKHCRMSLYHRLHLLMPRKPKTPLLLFSDLGAWFVNKLFCFLYCGTEKPFFGHFGHIQRQVDVGQFQLYPTFFPCHSRRHVENL